MQKDVICLQRPPNMITRRRRFFLPDVPRNRGHRRQANQANESEAKNLWTGYCFQNYEPDSGPNLAEEGGGRCIVKRFQQDQASKSRSNFRFIRNPLRMPWPQRFPVCETILQTCITSNDFCRTPRSAYLSLPPQSTGIYRLPFCPYPLVPSCRKGQNQAPPGSQPQWAGALWCCRRAGPSPSRCS